MRVRETSRAQNLFGSSSQLSRVGVGTVPGLTYFGRTPHDDRDARSMDLHSASSIIIANRSADGSAAMILLMVTSLYSPLDRVRYSRKFITCWDDHR
jgi:hypothetical protein